MPTSLTIHGRRCALRILIIGGTRFIGPPVVRRLHAAGHAVTLFHRGLSEVELPAEVAHIHGERARIGEFADQLQQVLPDVVLDMAAYSEADAQAVSAAFRGLARRIIVISSQDVYAAYGRFHRKEPGPTEASAYNEDAPLRTALFPYRGNGRGLDDYEKILVERAVSGSAILPATILRLPMVYGGGDPQHRLLTELKRMDDGRPAILLEERFAAWRWTRSYVENVAVAIVLAVTDTRATGRTYNVGDSNTLSYADWVRAIARNAGWTGEVVVLPNGRLPDKLQPPAGDYDQHLVADTTRIRNELGYQDIAPLDVGLRLTIDWERAHRPAGIEKLFDYPAEDAVLAEVRGAGRPAAPPPVS
ncbi:MAG: NAD-dependent epimerase/dehydratase family protein [Dehalococcoidia bacterium]